VGRGRKGGRVEEGDRGWVGREVRGGEGCWRAGRGERRVEGETK